MSNITQWPPGQNMPHFTYLPDISQEAMEKVRRHLDWLIPYRMRTEPVNFSIVDRPYMELDTRCPYLCVLFDKLSVSGATQAHFEMWLDELKIRTSGLGFYSHQLPDWWPEQNRSQAYAPIAEVQNRIQLLDWVIAQLDKERQNVGN